jgi:hypothetical protein
LMLNYSFVFHSYKTAQLEIKSFTLLVTSAAFILYLYEN